MAEPGTPEHNAEMELAAITGNSGTAISSDTSDGTSLIGKVLYDLSGRELGQFRPLYRHTGDIIGAEFVGVNGQVTAPPTGEVLVQDLGGWLFAEVGTGGTIARSRRATQTDLRNLGLLGNESTGGGSGTNQAALSAQGFQQDLAYLKEQERLLRERNEIDAARALADQITAMEEQHRLALERDDINATRDLEGQLAILAERFRLQGEESDLDRQFTADENALSRENAIRLQRLQDLSGLTRQILGDQAEARRLRASMMGDPFKSAALAQGLSPVAGTPADLLKGELDAFIQQPIPTPQSMSLEDIGATIDMISPVAAGGPPSGGGGFGLPPGTISAAHGATIDMRKSRGGRFTMSPTGRRGRGTRASGVISPTVKRPGEDVDILVGEGGRPELLTISDDEVRVKPLLPAAEGRRIIWPARRGRDSGFGPAPPRPGPVIPPTIGGGGTISPITLPPPPAFDPIPPVVTQPGPPSPFPRPVPTIPPTIPPTLTGPGAGPAPPVQFEGGPNAILQALASIFGHLGFQDTGIPTFEEGPRGGMLVPGGTLASDVFSRLGVGQPSNVRVLSPTANAVTGQTGGTNFWFNPATGQYERISSFTPGGTSNVIDIGQSNLAQSLLEEAGFDPSNFISEQLDPSAGRREHILGLPGLFEGNAQPFGGRDLLAELPGTPWPLRRNPIAVDFGDIWRATHPDEDPSLSPYGPGGIFLPSPRTIASFYRQSDPGVQAAILSAWENAAGGGFTQDQAFAEMNFFTPQGSFNPAQVAGFG